MPILLLALAAMWWFEVWPFDGTLTGRHTYQPEVGYWEDGERKWYVGGGLAKQDECVASATAQYNSYNARSPNRAFSWACRKMDKSGNFLERVR